jgi:GntR family transcriptional regulator, transcriptional repressor for pyruvate dehydrogenase complex
MATRDGHMPGARPGVELAPVRAPSSAALVADSLRRLIALGALSPGERLPSERRLAEKLHVGRDSIRAAMRILSEEALVETRLGRCGGTFVTDHPVQPQRLSAEVLASHREIAASYEFRRVVEPAAARLAAQRATAEEVAAIAAIAEEIVWSVRSWRAVDSRFHMAVAEASGNPLFVDAVHRTRTAFFSWYDTIYSRVPWETLPIQDRDIGFFHRPIAEAIAGRDPERAGDLMSAALEWSERDLIELLDGFVKESASGRGRPPHEDADAAEVVTRAAARRSNGVSRPKT